MKIMGNNFGVLETIANINPKDWAFFKEMVINSKDDLFLSTVKKNSVMVALGISAPTYFKRLKWAENEGILTREMKGVYRFNKKWIKLVTLEVSIEGADRKVTPVYQKLKDVKL